MHGRTRTLAQGRAPMPRRGEESGPLRFQLEPGRAKDVDRALERYTLNVSVAVPLADGRACAGVRLHGPCGYDPKTVLRTIFFHFFALFCSKRC